MLVQHLPPESATATALRLQALDEDSPLEPIQRTFRDVEAEMWSRDQHLLASVRDELHIFRWLYSYSHAQKKPKWDPEPLERPGVHAAKKRAPATTAQTSMLAQYLAQTMGDNATYN